MFRKHLIFTVFLILALGLTGCGSGGGSSSSTSSSGGSSGGGGVTPTPAPVNPGVAGGSISNHPVANAGVYADINGVQTKVGSSDAAAVVTIDNSKFSSLTASDYPIVLYVPAGNGTIVGTTQKYMSKLSSILESAPTTSTNVYFSIFSTMAVQTFEDMGGGTAALAAAKEKVKGVTSLMGLNGVDPFNSDPLTDTKMQLAQATVWTMVGIPLNPDESTGQSFASASTSVATFITDMAEQLKDPTKTANDAIANSNSVLDSIKSSGDVASAVAAQVQETAASDDFQQGMVETYGYTDTAAVSGTFTSVASTAKAAAASNVLTDVGTFSVYNATMAAVTSLRLPITNLRVGLNFNVKNLNATALKKTDGTNEAYTITATGTATTIGTFGTANSFAGTAGQTTTGNADYVIDPTLVAVGSYSLVFKVTGDTTGKSFTVTVPVEIYDPSTTLVVTDLQAKVFTTSETFTDPTQTRLVDFGSSTATESSNSFRLGAEVTIAGAGTEEYAVNFYPPSGLNFKKVGGATLTNNYMVPISTLTVGNQTQETGSTFAPDVKLVRAAGFTGSAGAIKAEIVDLSDQTTPLLSTIARTGDGSTTDKYSTFFATDDASEITKLVLTAKNGTSNVTSINFGDSVNATASTVDLASAHKLKIEFITWDGDTTIDAASTVTVSEPSESLRLMTTDKYTGGFSQGGGTYTYNLDLGTISAGFTAGSGTGKATIEVTAANFGGLTDDTPLSDYRAACNSCHYKDPAVSADNVTTASNNDKLWVVMDPTGDSIDSNNVILQYSGSSKMHP